MSIVTGELLLETLITSYRGRRLANFLPFGLVDVPISRLRKLEQYQSKLETSWNLDITNKYLGMDNDRLLAYIKSYALNQEIPGYDNATFSSLQAIDHDKSGIHLIQGEFTRSKSGFWLVISEPKHLKLEVTSDIKSPIAIINGSGYQRGKQIGNSIHSGHTITGEDAPGCHYIGLKTDDRLYISLKDNNYTQAVMFKPILILDGKIKVTIQNGWGIHPRTVLAQRMDKTIIFLITERRGLYNLGVNLFECAQLLHQLGAVQALNLDGGSSSTLIYKGKRITGRSLSRIPNCFTLS